MESESRDINTLSLVKSLITIGVFWQLSIPVVKSVPIVRAIDTERKQHVTEKDEFRSMPLRVVRQGCRVNPFDVECHGRCPRPDQGDDWIFLEQSSNCSRNSKGSTFHCAKNSSGVYMEACAHPIPCQKGKEPILTFPEGHTVHATVSCEWCPDDRFNPEEAKMSNTYPYCLYLKRECPSSEGQMECDVIEGAARHWTDPKCYCNTLENYLPHDSKENICTDDYSLKCVEHPPCSDTADGIKQEYLSSNYTCAPVCGDGFYQRTLDTDDCIPKEMEGNSTVNPNVTSTTVKPVRTTAMNVTKLIITDERDIVSKGQEKGINKTLLGVLLPISLAVVVLPFLWFIVRGICLQRNPRKGTNIRWSSPMKESFHAAFCWFRHIKLQPPVKPEITDVWALNDSSICVKWRKPTNDDPERRKIIRYKLHYRKTTDEQTRFEIKKINCSSTEPMIGSSSEPLNDFMETQISELDPSTEYEIKVQANGKYPDDPYSEPKRITTKASGNTTTPDSTPASNNIPLQELNVAPPHDGRPASNGTHTPDSTPASNNMPLQEPNGAHPHDGRPASNGTHTPDSTPASNNMPLQEPNGAPPHDGRPASNGTHAPDSTPASNNMPLQEPNGTPPHDGRPASNGTHAPDSTPACNNMPLQEPNGTPPHDGSSSLPADDTSLRVDMTPSQIPCQKDCQPSAGPSCVKTESWKRKYSQMPQDVKQKDLSIIQCTQLAGCIGKNWENLFLHLGLTEVRLDQIISDNPKNCWKQIFVALKAVKDEKGSVTLDMIYEVFCISEQTNVNWEEIIKIFSSEST